MVSIYAILALAFVVYLLFKKTFRKDLPPGPPALPLLGNAHQFIVGRLQGKSNVDVMREWKALYGSVYTMWLGPMPVVIVCDYKTAMDVFVRNGEDHAGRASAFVFQKARENLGLVFTDGPAWQEHRRFALFTLRNFGLGRNIMQQRILEEIKYRFEALDREIDDSKRGYVEINPTYFLDLLISSVINKLIAGYRYDDSNIEEFRNLKHSLDITMDILTPLDMILFNNYTYDLPLFRKRWAATTKPQFDIINLMRKQIADRRQAIASGQHHLDMELGGDDYIDAFFIEMEKRKQNGEDLGFFKDEYLAANVMDLWIAGTETTISSLLWCFIYILNDAPIQEKLRVEFHRITNGNREIELTDKSSMPYTNAVITESLRCGNVLNFNLLHRTTCKTVVGDYVIPENVSITPQVSVIMTEEKEFANPNKFDPDRYIKNKNLEKQMIPFGIGKRSCLGERLARAEMFLILSNFLQRYKISIPEGCDPPSMEQISLESMIRRARPYKMRVEKAH
ncbi:hypothetical protein QR680_009915 [Steinernema hermaphroditum]|uniref:Cytochrome P450 n=1 Tax=Steinernema hermaphroditum TaxID=289476 RepID=A0AA39IM32_9BILA|nr:hypothetical protein QR680_009915 [Steinernema hermaphroditum]